MLRGGDAAGGRIAGGGAWRVGAEQQLAVAAFDLVDDVRGDLVAAVGKGAPAGGDFHRRQGCSTQGQGQVARQVLLVEAELADVVDGAVHTHALQQADRHQVARLVQRLAHADRAEEGVGVVLRAPDLVQVFVDEHDRCVVHQAGRGVAVIQGGAIDERLEAGAGLALGLHRTVVIALLEGEAAHQGADRTVLRVQRHQGALGDRDLAELQRVVRLALHADQVADLGHVRRLARDRAHAVGIEERPGPFHAVPGHMFFAVAGQHLEAILLYQGDDRRFQAADGPLLGQFAGPGRLGLAWQARFRAAIAVALVVGHQAFMDRGVGHFLQIAGHRGGDPETFGVGIAAIAADHFGPGHLGDVRGVHFRSRYVIAGVQRFVDCLGIGRFGDLAELVHAPQDPVATFLAACRVGQGVEARRRLGQAGDHRHLRQAHVTDGLAVIHLGRCLDSVGTVAQVDLVDVQLEDLVLGQLPFDLQSQEDLGGLAREAALAAQEEVLRHLHGDGAAAGLDVSAFDQLGCGTHQAAGVNPVMVSEVVVFST